MEPQANKDATIKFFQFLGRYKIFLAVVVFISLVLNILTLVLPRQISPVLNSFFNRTYNENDTITLLGLLVATIFVLGILQVILGNFLSEKLARDLRNDIAVKISKQSFSYVSNISVSRLLTNLTSDVDNVKTFISQGVLVLFSAVVLLFGSAIMLISIDYKLAIPVILVIPALFLSFMFIFKTISQYFVKAQEVVDKLNLVINESVVGSRLVRVLNSQKAEVGKYDVINEEARGIGMVIVNKFASLIPIINLGANGIFMIVLGYGGTRVINGSMNFGDLTAFFSYTGTFIYPVILLGFLGNVVVRSFASYGRISEVLEAPIESIEGRITKEIKGDIELCGVNLNLSNRSILKDICFNIKAGTKTAILGPTAAGKTQIFYILTGLIKPQSGDIKIDGTDVDQYDQDSLYGQMGLVFQDSIIFNNSILENITLGQKIPNADLDKAIETSELEDFIKSLPKGLNTRITERGANLSGGQKQRLTLARALARKPKILLLDDFTARVDINTERRIFANLDKNYPNTTILAISQKIESVKDFDQIILIMEGELLAAGKHADLLNSSFEYKQIYLSQQSVE